MIFRSTNAFSSAFRHFRYSHLSFIYFFRPTDSHFPLQFSIEMANIVFKSHLTETEIQYCERVIQRHTVVSENCSIWTGTKDKNGYGEIRFQFRGKRVKVRVHRLVFYIRSNFTDMENFHVSHVCHKKACITYDHLSKEPAKVNNKRKSCVLNGDCIGHYGFKSCIL